MVARRGLAQGGAEETRVVARGQDPAQESNAWDWDIIGIINITATFTTVTIFHNRSSFYMLLESKKCILHFKNECFKLKIKLVFDLHLKNTHE